VLGMAEIQRADKQSLKLAILALVMLLLGGVVLSVQFEAWLAECGICPLNPLENPSRRFSVGAWEL
jgi:hypothetical protein